jgi:hypothetical protein
MDSGSHGCLELGRGDGSPDDPISFEDDDDDDDDEFVDID